MTIAPLLASGIPPIIVLFFLVPLLLAIFSIRGIRVAGGGNRAISLGIASRLIPVLGGGLFLFFFLTVRGGAPSFFYVISAFPLVVGLWSLYLFGRKRPEASRLVSITFRVLLYGFFALAFIGLWANLLRK